VHRHLALKSSTKEKEKKKRRKEDTSFCFTMATTQEHVSKKAKLADGKAGAATMDHDSPEKENGAGSSKAEGGYSEGNVHDLMRMYYSRLFPCKAMVGGLRTFHHVLCSQNTN
jgi:hypothetical protein